MNAVRERFGYQPWATSTEDAEAKMDAAEEAIVALVTALADDGSPLVAAQAAAGRALQALTAPGHPRRYVRMGDHLRALEGALTACQQAATELRKHRQWWGMASLDASSWRRLDREDGR